MDTSALFAALAEPAGLTAASLRALVGMSEPESFADSESFGALARAHDIQDRLPLHVACEKGASVEVVSALLAAHPDGAGATDAYGLLALHIACWKGASVDVVSALLAAHPEGLRAANKNGSLPLHYSCLGGASLDVVSSLLAAHPEGARTTSKDGQLPLHFACCYGASASVVSSLLAAYPEGARVANSVGQLPLHLACEKGASAAVVSSLLAAHPEGARATSTDGQLPLHRALEKGASAAVVSSLLAAYPEGARAATKDGWLPLHIALERGASAAVVSALLAAYPEGARAPDKRGRLSLHIALEKGTSLDVVSTLLAAHPEGARATDMDGRVPLHIALKKGAYGASASVVSAFLAAHPEGARATDKDGRLPLHIALENGASESLVSSLLAAHPEGARGTNKEGRIPLQIACERGASEAVVSALLMHLIASRHASSPTLAPFASSFTTFLRDHSVSHLDGIEQALDAHPSAIDDLVAAADEHGRAALELAPPPARKLLLQRLFLLSRFELLSGPAEHASPTSVVRLALDRVSNPPTRVALKFMRNRDEFDREVSARASLPTSSVLPLLGHHDLAGPDASPRDVARLASYVLSAHPYLLVMPAAERSLAAILDHERELPSWGETTLPSAARALTRALSLLHELGVVHGDVKPRNAVRISSTYALIDMDASSRVGEALSSKLSTAFVAPEVAAWLLAGRPSASAPVASPSVDAWSLGATLYQLLTGSTLFHASSVDDLADEARDLPLLASWPDSIKSSLLSRVAHREARHLLSLLLQRDPDRRPSLAGLLSRHPFLTGRPAAGRLPGEEPTHDVFLSYRQASDRSFVSALAAKLAARGVRVWWDANLVPGEEWRRGFCAALASSRVFVPVLSRGAVSAVDESGAPVPSRNWSSLTTASPCDNVLLEHRLAHELQSQRLLESVCPIFLGDALPPQLSGGGRSAGGGGEDRLGSFFAPSCAPVLSPTLAVPFSVEEEAARQVEALGLGALLTPTPTLQFLWSWLSAHQGSVASGPLADILESAARFVSLAAEACRERAAASAARAARSSGEASVPLMMTTTRPCEEPPPLAGGAEADPDALLALLEHVRADLLKYRSQSGPLTGGAAAPAASSPAASSASVALVAALRAWVGGGKGPLVE